MHRLFSSSPTHTYFRSTLYFKHFQLGQSLITLLSRILMLSSEWKNKDGIRSQVLKFLNANGRTRYKTCWPSVDLMLSTRIRSPKTTMLSARSLNLCPTFWRGQSLDLVSSMAWARPVSILYLLATHIINSFYLDALFYDVYTHLAELHLSDIGIEVKWQDVSVYNDNSDRWGSTREYFLLPMYRLPIGTMNLM